jgi:hypothetical protein
MRITIRGGTVNHGESSLCVTCRYATVIKGVSLKQEILECERLSQPHNRVAFPVRSCSGYLDRRQASLREMEEIAWVLRSDPKKNEIGFVRATELRPKDRYVLPDEW